MAPLSRDGDSEVAARRSEHHLTWLIWLLGVLAFYPLSTGHVIRIWRGLGLAEQPISILYAPLIAASRASPVIDGFFNWYVKNVWGVSK